MARLISIADALSSKKLFQPFFAGPSWSTWCAVLKAAFAEPLSDDELALFRAVAERDPPAHRVREGVFVVGRGGGKDSTASLIATYIAMSFDPRAAKLRPGEHAYVVCVAVDREQAAIVFRYIRAFFEDVPVLRAMVRNVGSDSIELKNRVIIEVRTNSFRSVRGRSLLATIFDETAFWRSEESANPDVEMHGAVSPGLARVPGSMLILISSAHKRSGLLYERWRAYYGKNDDDVLVVRGTTTQFNPTFSQAEIDKAIASDPQRYGAEYNSQWRDDLATFISRELIDASVDVGVKVRPPKAGIVYQSFCDPSGGASDSFTAAVAHKENAAAVLDCLIEIKAPFNPDSATADIAKTLKSYNIHRTTADRYAAQWVVAAFARHNITLAHSERDRSQIYLDCLPLFSSGRARLVDSQRLVSQFAALERRTFPTGKDRVDHGRSGHDDCCNAAAGALVLAVGGRKQMVITDRALALSAQGATMPASNPFRVQSGSSFR
jgi:hypothetical protein